MFLVTDNRVFNGPLGRSLRSFARTAHSAHSLHSARFAHSLRSWARSLPRGTVEILEYVFMPYTRSKERNGTSDDQKHVYSRHEGVSEPVNGVSERSKQSAAERVSGVSSASERT